MFGDDSWYPSHISILQLNRIILNTTVLLNSPALFTCTSTWSFEGFSYGPSCCGFLVWVGDLGELSISWHINMVKWMNIKKINSNGVAMCIQISHLIITTWLSLCITLVKYREMFSAFSLCRTTYFETYCLCGVWCRGLTTWLRWVGQLFAWWRHQMETFSALLAICAGNSPDPGEVPAQRPVTRSFDVFLDLRLNTQLSKQS